MIKIASNTLPHYFNAFPWKVEQVLGEMFEENDDFQVATLQEAKNLSTVKGLQRESRNMREHDRFTSMYMFITRIRALWNKKLRLALNKHDLETARLNTIAKLSPEEKLQIDMLPEILELNGVEVPIGTLIWWVDKFSMRMEEAKVEWSSVSWYRNPLYDSNNAITYHCGRIWFTSVDAENKTFDKTGQHYFFVKEDAIAFVKGLMQERMQKISDEFNSL